MIEAIVAGIGLGKLSEDIVNNQERDTTFINEEDDQVGWCPEMDNSEY